MSITEKLLRRIRRMIVFFIIMLVLSGITAFPVFSELQWASNQGLIQPGTMMGDWLQKVWLGVRDVQHFHPFLFYGFDWLAFAHLVIGTAFIGPYRDPVRNMWVIDWAMIACAGIIPLALIAGPVRNIPWFHILIDCSFGIIGIIPLIIVRKWINQLEKVQH